MQAAYCIRSSIPHGKSGNYTGYTILSARVCCYEFHNEGMCKYTKSRKGAWRVVVVLAMPNDTRRRKLMRIETLVKDQVKGNSTAAHIEIFQHVARGIQGAQVFH